MPSIAGTSSRPASVGLAPVVICRNSGTNTLTANSAAVPRNSAPLATATARVRSSPNGTIGSAARRSRTSSAPASTTVAAISESTCTESHAKRSPPQMHASISALVAPASSAAPETSSGRSGRSVSGAGQPQREPGEREDADRQVDEEHPAPARVVDQQAAEQRPDDRRDGERHRDVALVAPALAHRDQIAHGGHRQRHQPAGGHALDERAARSAAGCPARPRTAPRTRRTRSARPRAAACARGGRRACPTGASSPPPRRHRR